jgi:phage tail sheath gpL-like
MSIINPKIPFEIIPAETEEIAEDQKVLFVGQKTAAGTATEKQLYSKISNSAINGQTEWDSLFGKNSLLATAIRAAKKENKISRFDAIPLDDNGTAVAATGSITISSTVNQNATLLVTIGSKKNNKYEIDIVESTDTPTTVGDKVEAAITADDTSLVTANNVAGVVTFTAVNKGLEGDKITITIIDETSGLNYVNTGMSSGATNPVLTDVFDVIGNLRYQHIVWQSTFDLDVLKDFIAPRWNADIRILDGIGIVSITDTFSNLITNVLGGGGTPINEKSIAIHCNRLVSPSVDLYKGSALNELDFVIAAQFAAVRALRMTDGAPIAQFVDATQGSDDAFGGIAIASLPYFNTPFINLPVIDHEYQWLDDEQKELKEAGGFILGNNLANNGIIADRVVTTYLTNDVGNPDVTFTYMNYVDTSSVIRWYFHENLRERFKQSRLTTGDVVSGRNMANAGIIQGALMGFYKDLTELALLVAGEAARTRFLQNLTITITESTNRADIRMVSDIVTQLGVIAVAMKIAFSPTV